MIPPSSLVRTRRRAAFSLAELLIAIALVAILAALLFQGAQQVNASAKQSRCVAHLRQLGSIILLYSVERNGFLLPTLGEESSSGGTTWYSVLDHEDYLPGRPNRSGTWNDATDSIMRCPSRTTRPLWRGNSAGATLHYGMNHFPGFLNRTGKPGTSYETNYRRRYGVPNLSSLKSPNRAMMLGEIEGTYAIAPSNHTYHAHPHRKEGMNILFWDGHAELFHGPLPNLGSATSLKASDWNPEESYPFF